jgi:hypothetical protein
MFRGEYASDSWIPQGERRSLSVSTSNTFVYRFFPLYLTK